MKFYIKILFTHKNIDVLESLTNIFLNSLKVIKKSSAKILTKIVEQTNNKLNMEPVSQPHVHNKNQIVQKSR